MKHLKENNSKNEIRHCPKTYLLLQFLQIHKSNVERLCKHGIVLITCSIKFPKNLLKQHNSSNINLKISTSPNCFENSRLQDDSTNMSFQNKRTDNPSFIAKLALVPHKSEQMQKQNNKRNTLASNKSRRPSICTTKKYLQDYILQQKVDPGIASHAKNYKI